MVSASILQVQMEYSTSVSVPMLDTGIGASLLKISAKMYFVPVQVSEVLVQQEVEEEMVDWEKGNVF